MKKLFIVILFLAISTQTSSLSAQNWIDAGINDVSPLGGAWPKLASNGTNLYTGFLDSANNWDPHIYKLIGVTWTPVGLLGLTPGITSYGFDFDVKNTGPILAYPDTTLTGDLTISVSEYNELTLNWQPLGLYGFSGSNTWYPDVEIGPASNTPYVAFNDSNWNVSVMKFNGSSWEYLGTPGCINGDIFSLAVDENDSVYIAFRDADATYELSVKKFNGSTWEYVGAPSISNYIIAYDGDLKLTFDGNIPYVAYADPCPGCPYSKKMNVKKFDGNVWSQVGSANFNTLNAGHISIDIDNGNPVVSFVDYDTLNYIHAMYFDGSDWIDLNNPVDSFYVYQTDIELLQGSAYVCYNYTSIPFHVKIKKFDQTIGISTVSEDELLKIYPNPSAEMVHISTGDPSITMREITIYNSVGQMVYSARVNDQFEVDIDCVDFPAGSYFIRVFTGTCYSTSEIMITR